MLNIKKGFSGILALAVICCGVNLCMADNVKFSKQSWTLYPKGTNVKFEEDNKISDNGKIYGKLTIPDTTANFSIYTYAAMKEKRNYKVNLSYKLKDIQISGNSQSQIVFNFNKLNGGNGSAGALKFPLRIENTQDDWQTFSTEIQTPAETSKCQISINIAKIKGTIWLGDFMVEEISDDFTVYKTLKKPVIDGKLDDECWQKAVPLKNFYLPNDNAAPANTATTARISYDDNNLYIAFKNDEPEMNRIKSQVKERDGNVWEDDCNEIFIAAPNGNTYQFLVNSVNGQCDARIFAKVPGDPYAADTKWNGNWTCAAAQQKDSWTTEICIPVSNFQADITNGSKWFINLARERKVSPELSHFNRVADNFNNVAKFATLEFAGDSAILTRYSEKIMTDPLKITRMSPKYKELLSKKPGDYITGVWSSDCILSNYPPKLKEKYTAETFAIEQENILIEYGQAGIAGPAFPWLPNYLAGGMETVKKFNERYKSKFWFALFSSGQDKAAITRGAKYISKNSTDPNDPEYQEIIEDYIKSYFPENQEQLPYMAFILGKDEPMNNIFEAYSITLNENNRAALLNLDEKIKNEFGFGKFGLYDAYAKKNDQNVAAFNKIAFIKWWNSAFMENTKAQRESVKQYAPDIAFISHNMNCVRGMGMEDISLLSLTTDYVSADPYPTSAMYNFGRNRGLYHTGFSFKFIKDLSGNKPAAGFIQAFTYCGRSPSPSDIREWASQALKNGANMPNWFSVSDTPLRVALPDTYKELLRVCNIIHKMNKLEIPEETQTAILFSNSSFIGNNDEAVHSWYTTYSILGENLKTWFRFVSDSGLRLKLDKLSRYKLVYVPQIKYTDRATAEALLEYVKNGGKAIIFDPEAFTWNVDGTPLDVLRNEIVGCLSGKPAIAKTITVSIDYPGLKKGDELPLTPIANRTGYGSVLAFEITPPADAKVIASYPDGKPAAFERTVGKGSVIYFAAQPFGNSDLAVKSSPWSAFMKAQAEQIGEKMNLPIWDFELPATGSEIEVKYVIKPDAK
ncbi:MAG: sugar-binding protein [Victivallaceae bacterium]|jgi:hypothetical protein